MATDLLGRTTTPVEDELLALYDGAKRVLAGELDPCVRANVRAALVGLWNACNDLGLVHEQLLEHGA